MQFSAFYLFVLHCHRFFRFLTRVSGEERRRRLLSCILLIGGGAAGFGGYCLQRMLLAQLTSMLPGSSNLSRSDSDADESTPHSSVTLNKTTGDVREITSQAPPSGHTVPSLSSIRHAQNSAEFPIEVLLRPSEEAANMAWFGARLLLTADSTSELWITPAEWHRFGSRTLREKAPFLW
ncbi:unnamed protein product [Protopolystoma xenopodis]|uniref:Uncharacterized protein n=1 Tax=Protopolystoma xenopodis TaxID=117903 RepID=A0A448X5F0_9PLAT|nr:unnamed protein product [Protopolystoma xenopodis]